MNPNATPENIKAAEAVVREQTEATVADIEAARERNRPQHAAIRAELIERSFQEIEKQRNRPVPIVAGTLVFRDSTGIDGKTEGRVVTLSGESKIQGSPTLVVEIYTNDTRLTDASKGSQFEFELRPTQTAAEITTAGRSGFGKGPDDAPEIPKEAPEITGTTGSRGTTPASVRSQPPAEGKAPDPEDPNLTGPSSDKQQPVKGEIVEGQQTGGTSGKGTSDGTREDSQFARHHGGGKKK